MTTIIVAVWMFFVAAFLLVRLIYPDVGSKKRKVKHIRPKREYDDFGYDENGFTALGYHRNGTRYDDEGYDRNGLDKQGNPRPNPISYEAEAPVLNGEGEVTVTESQRKRLLTIVMAGLTVVMALLLIGKYVFFDSCIMGHKPMEKFCERPMICIKCEKEVGEAPGHSWIKDGKTGEEICVKCRAQRSDLE